MAADMTITLQEFATKYPYQVEYALLKAGLNRDLAEYALNDFIGDHYWNDPKCLSRRIRADGGTPATFYDYCKITITPDWGE